MDDRWRKLSTAELQHQADAVKYFLEKLRDTRTEQYRVSKELEACGEELWHNLLRLCVDIQD